MGLNISVYIEKKFLGNIEPKTEEWDFATHDKLTNKRNGFYKGKRIGHTGNIPYSTYGMYRKKLCELTIGKDIEDVWKKPNQDYPFINIINFSDCEGHMGNKTCHKLYKEFIEWDSKIKGFTNDKNFLEFYQSLIWIFKLAVDNKGIIIYS